jgi:hemerythrin superfamily protein
MDPGDAGIDASRPDARPGGGVTMPDVFAMLEADHRHVEALLGELAETDAGPEREALVATLTQALQLHMQFEEQDVYPLLEQVDGEMEQEAEVEHGLARDGLAKMTELVAAPGFGAAVDMVTAGISHHVEEEEHEAFPQLRQSCDEAVLAGLGRALLARKAEAGVLADHLGAATKDDLAQLAQDLGVEGRSAMTKAELIAAITSSVPA